VQDPESDCEDADTEQARKYFESDQQKMDPSTSAMTLRHQAEPGIIALVKTSLGKKVR
jgi:hypothetical protein